VLYEMMTGRRPFEGKSQANLIAAILDTAPTPITSLQPLTPPILDHIVQKCLAKVPEERWQNAQDAASELHWIATQPSVVSPPPTRSKRQVAWSRMRWVVAALSFVAMLAIVGRYGGREPSNGRVVRLSVLLPEKTRFPSWDYARDDGPAISPNGRSLAFAVAHATGDAVLWIRSLDDDAARPLASTDGAQFPFWSPDSESLGFFANGKLKRVPASGGTPQVLCDARQGLGGTWNQDGTIVFVPKDYSNLVRVSANGGTPTSATTLDQARHELLHRFPQFLPDGRHFLYLAQTARQADSVIYVGALGSVERTMVMRGNTSVAYDPSGRLLFGRDGVLMAQPFDLRTFTLSGGPTTIAERAILVPGTGSTLFSASATGIVAYRNTEPLQSQLTWVDRRGKPVGSVGPPGAWDGGRVSPDGKKVALQRQETAPQGADLWMLDLARGTTTRFTDDPSWDQSPIWSPDGRRIVFSSDRAGPQTNLYVRASDGATKEERLRESTWGDVATDWSPDGTSIVYWEGPLGTLWQLPLSGARKPVPLVQNNFNNSQGVFSPDGRWLAYQSDESGRWEIYNQPLTTPGERVRISTNGGILPRWRRDGKELFYRDPDNRIIAVELRRDDVTLEPGSPSVLFSLDRSVWWYDVASDGQRFLVPLPVAGPASSMTVVMNWTELLKQRVPAR
jgi:Tol biopolymer transport system component